MPAAAARGGASNGAVGMQALTCASETGPIHRGIASGGLGFIAGKPNPNPRHQPEIHPGLALE